MNIFQDFTPEVRNFIECYMRNKNRNKFTRKYTIDDKLFAFTLYKRSAAAYQYLSNIFCLPSVETVRKLSLEIPLKPGICESVFTSLEERGKKMKDPKDKLCVLMCDDMEIEASIFFNKKEERVEGFEDDGSDRTDNIADHASSWIVKGINSSKSEKPWSQAIVFSFCKSSIIVTNLKKMYVDIVRRLRDIGFIVVASICDQGATNEKSVKELIRDTKEKMLRESKEYIDDTIFIDGHEIVHLFDPPHLLKCLRNNLLKKDLNYTWKSKSRKASWSHIETAFQIDKCDGIFRLLKKLTEAHIYPKDKEKMRVNLCKNVFSHTTAVVMMNMCKYERKSPDGKLEMSKEGEDTALLLYLIDKIFDSVNCDEKPKSKKNNKEEEENEEPS